MKKLILILFVAFFSLRGVYAETLDKIAAVVDDQVILLSELDAQIQVYAIQSRITISDSLALDSLRREFLDKMIEDKVLLVKAEKDTTIKVTNQEVGEALTRQIEMIKSQFPSEEAFLAQLRAEGLTLRELREQYHDEIKNQILKDKLIQKRLAMVKVSSGEVKEFFEANRDSLPEKPAGIRLSHILIGINPGKATLDSLYNFAALIRDKAVSGENFETLAKNYSDDPSSENGGDLGWFSRGEMVSPFEDAAFALQPGEISNVVETVFGFHVIKVTGRKEDRIKASHILIKLAPGEEDREKKLRLADSLYQAIETGADFAEVAKEYSDDENSVQKGGELGWYAANDLLPGFITALQDLDTGEISPPVASEFGYHILRIEEKRAAGSLDPKEDFKTLEEMARRDKTHKQLKEWLDRISSEIYIEKRL
ncbi:MAG: peptidylprolyl isomerase [Candidatus Zixiibacteriota bacterium]|nr:MAG: peptidylprolyl isomerase [candidate division Zixibacteria bacterium]